MKTTYYGTYTQVDELQNTEGKIILQQKVKDNVQQTAFVRANFLSGARFLQHLKDSTLLTIDEVIETPNEISIVCKYDGFQQLGVYLTTQSQWSDAFLVELIKKMLACLDTLHKNSVFHQGLNPNSFIINAKGKVKLTLFGILEHRLYHHMPTVGSDNPSIQNAVRFYSPERKVNYAAINQESEYYSIGLIIWYLRCIQLNLVNTQALVLDFPEYVHMGSIWDKVIEACLQDDSKKRPNSIKNIIELLPTLEEAISDSPRVVIPEPSNEPKNSPPNRDETLATVSTKNKKSTHFVSLFILVTAGIIGYIFYTSGNKRNYEDNHPGTIANAPEGYSIADTLFNSVLTKDGFNFNNETKWRYFNGAWEKCDINNGPCFWKEVEDPSYKKWLNDFFFKEIKTNGYKYSDKEVKDFIINYYKFLDEAIDLYKLGDFFEPVIAKYYNLKNVSSSYSISEISKALSLEKVNHQINPNSFITSYTPESATVQFKLIYTSINKFNHTKKTSYVDACIILSNNLKISSIFSQK